VKAQKRICSSVPGKQCKRSAEVETEIEEQRKFGAIGAGGTC